MNNWEISQIFYEIADLLDILGENPYKSRAYRRAAHKLGNTYLDVEQLAREGRLQEIPGIGSALEKKIKELITTGRLGYRDNLRKKVPASLRQLLLIPGIGTKTVQILYQQMEINDLIVLEAAAREKQLQKIPGIGVKTEEAILRGLETLAVRQRRLLLHHAFAFAQEIEGYLTGLPDITEVRTAGSLRRGKETIGDLDFAAAAVDPKSIVEAFTAAPFAQDLVKVLDAQATIMTRWGIQVNLLVVKPEFFPSALQHLTGSKEHNAALRGLAQERGWKINEYGIYQNAQVSAPNTEDELYRQLGISFIPPELREGGGEIEAAISGMLPDLVETRDLKGDLHVHSEWSDGANTLEKLALAARERGYQYLAITDHSKSLHIAHGLTEERIQSQREEIDRINKKYSDFRLLAGIEVEILTDGSLDFDDQLLAEMDLVVASVHSGFQQDKKTLTRRVVAALRNKNVDIVGHPTGRLLGRRDPYEIDIDFVLDVAAETGTALEINSSPDRLDLRDQNIRKGKRLGVRFAINTDAHDLHYFDDLQYGVLQARRGWAEKKDIVNTLSLHELDEWLHRN